jgi:hypothetical protein
MLSFVPHERMLWISCSVGGAAQDFPRDLTKVSPPKKQKRLGTVDNVESEEFMFETMVTGPAAVWYYQWRLEVWPTRGRL